jgi:hypothetical protein
MDESQNHCGSERAYSQKVTHHMIPFVEKESYDPRR